MTASKPRESLTIDQWRERAWTLRIEEGLSVGGMVERLTLEHGINVSTATISRDLEHARLNEAKTFVT